MKTTRHIRSEVLALAAASAAAAASYDQAVVEVLDYGGSSFVRTDEAEKLEGEKEKKGYKSRNKQSKLKSNVGFTSTWIFETCCCKTQ